MNRKQAEHILDAYVHMHDSYETGKRQAPDVDKALSSLREVILDAMTSIHYYPITMPQPKVDPYKPIVTWTEKSNAD